jgi:hypothetical protein
LARKRANEQQTPAAEMRPRVGPARDDGRVGVVFSRAHHHAGVDYLPGDGLFVTPAERDLLRHFDVIEAD